MTDPKSRIPSPPRWPPPPAGAQPDATAELANDPTDSPFGSNQEKLATSSEQEQSDEQSSEARRLARLPQEIPPGGLSIPPEGLSNSDPSSAVAE